MSNSIEFFPEFGWAVPKNFAVPLRDCRFEQGDRLFDTKLAYEGNWNEAKKHIKHSIEVIAPPRGEGVTKTNADSASTFESNWDSSVVIELTDHANGDVTEIKTTQGRLYSSLWWGKLQILDTASPEPKKPRKNLNINFPEVQAVPFFGMNVPKGKFLFLVEFDETNDISFGKCRAIHNELKDVCSFEFLKERPDKLYGRPASEGFVPTLYLGCYVIDSKDRTQIEAAFKRALYVPVKNKITDRENWRLEKHGKLVQYGI